MSLTNNDKQWIKGAIVDGITEAFDQVFMPQIERLDTRMNSLETEMKQEFASVHSSIAHLQEDVDGIKETLRTLEALKSDIDEIYTMVEELKEAERQNSKDIAALRKDLEEHIRDADKKLHILANANGVTL